MLRPIGRQAPVISYFWPLSFCGSVLRALEYSGSQGHPETVSWSQGRPETVSWGQGHPKMVSLPQGTLDWTTSGCRER